MPTRHLPIRRIFAKILSFTLIAALLSGLFIGCGPAETPSDPPADSAPAQNSQEDPGVTFTDALGREISWEKHERVVSLYGSFAETWLLAGGALVGVTEDAIEERDLDLSQEVSMIGSVKQPNFEEILALEPDFVILSADIATQVDLSTALEEAQIPHGYFRVDTFQEYLDMLELFTTVTGQKEAYEEYGTAVEEQIYQIKELVAKEEGDAPTVLLIRAFSTGAKAKGTDNLAGVILEELGADNLVSRHPSLLEDLSIEEIIGEDPQAIFISTMGDEEEAMAALSQGIQSNPAWESLSAVQSGRVYLLPKELFHYKPNARWGESYAYLAKLLYPQLEKELESIASL